MLLKRVVVVEVEGKVPYLMWPLVPLVLSYPRATVNGYTKLNSFEEEVHCSIPLLISKDNLLQNTVVCGGILSSLNTP